MKDSDLISALRQLKVNTKSLACMGCGYENSCGTRGCRLIGLAADRLAAHEQAIETIKAMHTVSSGIGKSLPRVVLDLSDPAHGNPPFMPNNIISEPIDKHRNDLADAVAHAFRVSTPQKRITDFELCADTAELAKTLRSIDDNGYYMSGVTQDGSGVYTVFFRRPARE